MAALQIPPRNPRREQKARDEVDLALQGAFEAGELAPEMPVVLAVSGGADSVAMLHAIATLPEARRLDASLVHVDHGLRPESAGEAEAVLALAETLGLPAEAVSVEVEGPGGPQAAARRARYAALETVADRLGAERILTAHTATDQAETVLLRLCRGSAPGNLGGIPRRRGRLLRPLLTVSRETLRAYCEEEGLPVLDDPTNANLASPRARVRHELLPALAGALNPRLVETLAGLAERIQDEDALLAGLARELADSARRDDGLDAAILAAAPAALTRRVLATAWLEAAGEGAELSSWHLEAIRAGLPLGDRPRSFTLPGGVNCEIRGRRVTFSL